MIISVPVPLALASISCCHGQMLLCELACSDGAAGWVQLPFTTFSASLQVFSFGSFFPNSTESRKDSKVSFGDWCVADGLVTCWGLCWEKPQHPPEL